MSVLLLACLKQAAAVVAYRLWILLSLLPFYHRLVHNQYLLCVCICMCVCVHVSIVTILES